MTQASRIRRNYFFSVLSISSRLIANVIVFWIIARYYGPIVFGQFAFAQTLATIFIIFADFGFDVLLTNEVARNREKAINYFQQFFTLKVIFTLISIVLMWVFAILNHLTDYSKALVFVFSLYMAFTALTNFLFALYKGFERLEYETKVSLITNILLLLSVVILVIFQIEIIYIAFTFVLSRIIGFIIGVKYSFLILKNISFRPSLPNFRDEKNKIFVYGFHLVFSYLFFQLDTILLAIWKGEYEIGIYQSVFKIIMIFLVLPEIFVNTLLPALSRLNIESITKWTKIGYLMNKVLFIVIIPISICIFVFAENIIDLIYGIQNYNDAVPILRVFAIILFVRFNMETYALMLTTANRQHVRMYSVIFASIFNVVLNCYAIPNYGVFGAAIVSLITNVLVGTIYISFTKPLFYEWLFNYKVIVTLVLSAVVAIILWVIKDIYIFYSSPIFVGVFFAFAYFYFFSDEEKSLIFSDRFKFINLKIK